MDLLLILGIIFANVVALFIVYQILKRLPKKEILVFMAASVTIIYILILFVYFLSGIGIDTNIHENAKNFIVYLFVPVNIILFVPYVAIQYKKIRENKLDLNKLLSKIATIIAILIVVSIGEFFYFKNIQNNIKVIGNGTKTNTNEQSTEGTNIIENNTVEQNTINNQIANDMTNNTVSSTTNSNTNTLTNNVTNEITNQIVNNKTNTIN